MATHYLSTILRQLEQLHPAALLAVIAVVTVFLACAAAGLLARTNRDDCGLRYEGTYSPRIRRHNGRQ